MRRILGPLLVLNLAAAAPSACNGRNAATVAALEAAAPSSSAAADPSAAASADASVSAAPVPPVHHRGIAGQFFRAALEADLTDEEKTAVDKLEEPLRNDPGPRREFAAFHADLVLAAKAGRLDTAKLQADEAAVNKAYVAREEEQTTSLAGLHDALTPEQRKAVVDALRAMQAAHEHPPSVSGVTEAATTRRLEHMKMQLGLDADQQRQVAAVLARADAPTPAAVQARFEASKKQMEVALTAFEREAFDAKKVDLSPFPGRKPSEPLERQARYIGQLLPILRSEQRDRLAALMDHPRVDHGHGAGDSIVEPLEPTDSRGR